jgi:hypothetical protein
MTPASCGNAIRLALIQRAGGLEIGHLPPSEAIDDVTAPWRVLDSGASAQHSSAHTQMLSDRHRSRAKVRSGWAVEDRVMLRLCQISEEIADCYLVQSKPEPKPSTLSTPRSKKKPSTWSGAGSP